MKNKKAILAPIKVIGIFIFLAAFTLNIQTSLNGEWELVNAGFAKDHTVSTSGSCFAKYVTHCPITDPTKPPQPRVQCILTGLPVAGERCTVVSCNNFQTTLECSEGGGTGGL
jgi:hypothetical protein